MTYYLNRLQALDEPEHYCVTLNRAEEIREDRIVASMEYDHPLYTLASLRAQEELGRLDGLRQHGSTPAPTTASASTRTAWSRASRRRVRSGPAGEVGALHRNARPRAARAR